MKVNFYTSKREYLEKKAEFDKAIFDVVESGSFILGPQVKNFEEAIKEYTGAKHAIGVASGTDALVIASNILGFENGAEVITSPFTFLASTSCIAKHRATPVFVDIDEETFEMDLNQIESKVNSKTKGILPIHLFSQMNNMDKIMEIANKNDLRVLEDAAEAFGMRWKGNGDSYRHSGTIGDMGIFSFFPTKTLGGYGDGGMIVTNSDELAERTRMFRVHGASKKYHYDYIGYNSRLDSMQAAVLSVKLKYINDAIKKREEIANMYMEKLQDCEYIRFPKIKGDQKPVYYVFNIRAERRDELVAYLKENEIGNSIYYPIPLHMQKCFSYLGHKEGDFPVAEKVSKEILALPIYPELKEEEVDFVCETIKKFYTK
ncbi:DegT/DnrJ/EryC1/StrS family aminotransferase [Clostridium botulinum]|uniref:Pleiotropic regulatory protein n=1 Tax=Clostridium botulinum (strain Hall / ATCC 3502 / NCTC 13319 / Type A) TaxID=441771 RepID=A5I026_CLOBH|nr:DegT/DnrJ/EryC1/StrS family aminotransferase [Clostridium botulinum]ABS33661.1 putative pleiotropic regulatory protein DegT [Clostridium botulinum A str. ATCC 19397]ABS39202.1 putative pleiotropic regulatory protein DegT [Clostridium botulinum A str. Hall]AWB16753.1 DegT/DnrJ/EryC1/StrS family aminotransferase [Clostridium botulinum]EGT5613873.1 DegT/DnrJ/EryC1/StrS family aminotransferase [Clostridium botulinum]EGT5620574.1 DegT/DnrJ/EryC1/StrS family aminotransferase [Clostridium botulinu